MKDTLLVAFLVLALALSVPLQATLALSAAPGATLGHCHDAHSDHGKVAGLPCDACCAPPIVGMSHPIAHFPVQEPQRAEREPPPFGELPDGPDRPPQGS